MHARRVCCGCQVTVDASASDAGASSAVAVEATRPKTTFARKQHVSAESGAASVDVDGDDVEAQSGVGTGIARRPSLVSNYANIKRANSFADMEYADVLIIASVNNTAAYDSTDPNVVIGDASVRCDCQ